MMGGAFVADARFPLVLYYSSSLRVNTCRRRACKGELFFFLSFFFLE